MTTYLRYIGIGAICLLIGAGIGHFAGPAKIVTQTKYKEIIKEVEVTKEKKDVVVYKKKTIKKDGTIIEESRTEDKSITYQDSKKESSKNSSSSSVATRDIGLSIHIMALQDFEQRRDREFGVMVKKRIIGNISVGGLITDKKTVGVSVGMDF